ncbi:MAG: hypothetical protein MI757_17175 [Pirellulales bacterium]|nr:hypothetical protein [Pirellulales bacterium]
MAWTDTNWKAESQKAATYAAENNAREGPVGVMRWGPPGTVAIYGHASESGVHQARAIHCAMVTRTLLANAQVEVLSASLDSKKRAWAILVESDALDLLDAIVDEAWEIAEPMVGLI